MFQGRVDETTNKEGLRICLTSGIRIDFTCITYCDENIPVLPKEQMWRKEDTEAENSQEEWVLEKADSFWFNTILALGKLMRKDYLISAHLAHMLLMEGLVVQMIDRDNRYHTNVHRYGYSDKVEYLSIEEERMNVFKKLFMKESIEAEDETYNYIAKLLYQSVVSYDNLVPLLNKKYTSRRNTFFDVWRCYLDSQK